MATLPTNYTDPILDTSVNEKRRFNLITNADGTVSLEEVTTYLQTPSSIGAIAFNNQNAEINEALKASNMLATQAEVLLNTVAGRTVDALVEKQIITSLTANGNKAQVDYQSSKYGITIGGTFYPFGSGVELLWTNSAPSSAFVAQTISLDLSDFSGVIIKMKSSTTEANSRKFYFDKGSVGYMIIEYYLDNIAGNHAERKVTSVSDTGVTFAGGQYSTGYNDNNYSIPLQIWGVA